MTAKDIHNTFSVIDVTDDVKNPLPALPGLRQSPLNTSCILQKKTAAYDEVFGQ